MKNKYIRILVVMLLVCSIVFTAGCNKKTALPPETFSETTTEPKPTETEPPTTENCVADPSLTSFRQAMVDTPNVFAVAYLGYPEVVGEDLQSDPFAIMQENAYWLCEDLPFLMEIPQDRIVGENGELYCIVPRDENATVTVCHSYTKDIENKFHNFFINLKDTQGIEMSEQQINRLHEIVTRYYEHTGRIGTIYRRILIELSSKKVQANEAEKQ